tara:strand:+ start:4079 stop:4399 length:321 start_codon:yes stop_codon:yes gene_type:complete
LNKHPDLKKLLKSEIEKGAFEKTTVRWERGHPVTLLILDRDDKEVERHAIETWTVDDVREALQTRGFHHTQTKMPSPKRAGLFTKHDTGKADRTTTRTQPVHTQTG